MLLPAGGPRDYSAHDAAQRSSRSDTGQQLFSCRGEFVVCPSSAVPKQYQFYIFSLQCNDLHAIRSGVIMSYHNFLRSAASLYAYGGDGRGASRAERLGSGSAGLRSQITRRAIPATRGEAKITDHRPRVAFQDHSFNHMPNVL